MNNEMEDRLKRLAEIVGRDKPRLNSDTDYLLNEHGKGGGPSILGLICVAYTCMTSKGRWEPSNEPEIRYFIVGREIKDKVLPTAVVEYFGLRDNIGTFDVRELPQGAKTLMTRLPKTPKSSLLEIGRANRNNGKEIAARIIESLPPSLRKREPKWLTDDIPQSKPLKIDLTGIE